MQILFVEDNARFVCVAISQFLVSHEVVTVSGVLEALAMLSERAFDAVLLDFDLSDGKGSVVAQAASQIKPKPFIVAISSHEVGNAKLMEAGADAICSKMKFSNIISVLETHFDAFLTR